MSKSPPPFFFKKKNWLNKTVFTYDNLPVMRRMNSNSVDLIYLDPPFNSNKSFSAPIGSKAAGASFDDAWKLKDADYIEWDLLSEKHEILGEKLKAVIQAAQLSHSDSMFSYLLFMTNRLIECHRILKPTGSPYLHCDPYAGHYLKLILDCIFGRKNFRNEIIWQYFMGGKPRKDFARKHDTIFRYCKSRKWVFNRFKIKRYLDFKPSLRDDSKEAQFGKDNIGYWSSVQCPDVWQIKSVFNMSKEYVGYPTQKPLKLLDRIIKASSNPGDIVFDPFCGCATTLIAAERLSRQWVGIDISPTAIDLVKERIKEEGGLLAEINDETKLPDRTDLGAELTKAGKKQYKKVLFGQQSGYCRGCQNSYDIKLMEIDRIIPGVKGGTYHKENLQLLCSHCNRKKRDRRQSDFLKELAELRGQNLHFRSYFGLE